MGDEYKIEKGIPVSRPRSGPAADPFTLAMRAMEVGDSIKVGRQKPRGTISRIMTREGYVADKVFTFRTILATETEPEHYRVWRVK